MNKLKRPFFLLLITGLLCATGTAAYFSDFEKKINSAAVGYVTTEIEEDFPDPTPTPMENGPSYRKEIRIGRTTVYRGLERLQKEGAVLKVPSVEGAPAQYRFIRDEERKNYGKLVCLECGHTIPLQCGCIDHFVGHVLDEHGFEIDQSRTIFYGYCDSCRRLKK